MNSAANGITFLSLKNVLEKAFDSPSYSQKKNLMQHLPLESIVDLEVDHDKG